MNASIFACFICFALVYFAYPLVSNRIHLYNQDVPIFSVYVSIRLANDVLTVVPYALQSQSIWLWLTIYLSTDETNNALTTNIAEDL